MVAVGAKGYVSPVALKGDPVRLVDVGLPDTCRAFHLVRVQAGMVRIFHQPVDARKDSRLQLGRLPCKALLERPSEDVRQDSVFRRH